MQNDSTAKTRPTHVCNKYICLSFLLLRPLLLVQVGKFYVFICLTYSSYINRVWGGKKQRETERDRQTERQTERERERERDRQTDREKETDRQTDRQRLWCHVYAS